MVDKIIYYNQEPWYISDKYIIDDYRYTFDITNCIVSYKCDVFYTGILFAEDFQHKLQQIKNYEQKYNIILPFLPIVFYLDYNKHFYMVRNAGDSISVNSNVNFDKVINQFLHLLNFIVINGYWINFNITNIIISYDLVYVFPILFIAPIDIDSYYPFCFLIKLLKITILILNFIKM